MDTYEELKAIIHNKDISRMNIYAPNKTSTTFIKQEVWEMTVIIGGVNKPFLFRKRSSRHKVSRERDLKKSIGWILGTYIEFFYNSKYTLSQ